LKRIAVVEDEAYMREEIAEMLRNAGFEVDEIISFEDTAGQLLRSSPDLILLDINLPQASGFQICREIKQKSAIPVLVLTSRDQMRDELHALELGADEYLTKPCRKERLLARTANVLKRYEGRSHMLEGPGFLLDRQTYALYIHNRSVVLPGNQKTSGSLSHPWRQSRKKRGSAYRPVGNHGVYRRKCSAGQSDQTEKDHAGTGNVSENHTRPRCGLSADS